MNLAGAHNLTAAAAAIRRLRRRLRLRPRRRAAIHRSRRVLSRHRDALVTAGVFLSISYFCLFCIIIVIIIAAGSFDIFFRENIIFLYISNVSAAPPPITDDTLLPVVMSLCVMFSRFEQQHHRPHRDGRNNKADRSRHLWQPWVERAANFDGENAQCTIIVTTISYWCRDIGVTLYRVLFFFPPVP